MVEFEPNKPGAGFAFESRIVGGVIPKEYIPAVEAGIRDALQSGPLGGYELIDIKATLLDGPVFSRKRIMEGIGNAPSDAYRQQSADIS